MRDRLLKLASIADFVLQHDMTPDDHAKLQAYLDQQKLPKHPNHVASMNHVPEPVKDSLLQRGLRHVRSHKLGYGLGAAGLLGAGLVYRKIQDSPTEQNVVMDQQAGF